MKEDRLFSLDVLRGLDMLFLCVGAPILWAIANGWGPANAANHWWVAHLVHNWGGFTAYDLIMPLFIFMCGAAVPFALTKRLDAEGRPTAAYWRHVAGRFLLLWIFGMIAQGRLLQCDLSVLSPFNNTLQTIACGYLIAAFVLPIRCRWVRGALPVALALAYGVFLAAGGDYSPDGNLAIRFERWFVPILMPAGNRAIELADPHYTWWATIPMFGAMTLCGMEMTEVLRSTLSPWRKAAVLGAVGVGLWSVGWLMEVAGIPCIKHIFTPSFTAQAMGISVLLLGALYVITDIGRLRRGWWLVTLYGQTALAAYMVGETFRQIPDTASNVIFGGLANRIGNPWRKLILELGLAAALTLFLWLWRRRKVSR